MAWSGGARSSRTSDIGLHWAWYDIALVLLLLGSPGAVAGAVVGALLWRRHRIVRAAAAAVGLDLIWAVLVLASK